MRTLNNGIGFLIGLWGVGPNLASQQAAPHVEERVVQAELWRKIGLHPYLSRVSFDTIEELAPYLFLVQRKEDQSTGQTRAMAERAAALLEPMRARFERELALPLALKQREDEPRLVIVLLTSAEDYEECNRACPGSLHLDTHSTFERSIGAAILYDDPTSQRDPAECEHSAHHALIHVLQHAWYGGADESPARSWLFEGMAVFMSRPPNDGPSRPNPEWVEELVGDSATPARRWAGLRTFEELCTVDEPLGLQEFFRLRTRDERLVPTGDTWIPFYRQAALLYHFFQESDGGSLRPGLMKFTTSAFAGDRSAAALTVSFAPLELADLERSFLAWIVAEQGALAPVPEIDERRVLEALTRTASGCVLIEEPKPVTERRPGALPGLEDLTLEERFAWALAEVTSGGMKAGYARLEEILAGAPDADLRSRIEREERRITAWVELRDAFLAKMVAEQGLLGLTRDATQTKLRVKSFEQGELVLLEKYGGTRRVSVEQVDQLGLAHQIPKGKFAGDWARYYLFVLQGDTRWKKLLQDDGGAAGELLADAHSDYPLRLPIGNAALRLQDLLQASPPHTAQEMDERLECLRELLKAPAENSLIQRKRPALLEHTRAILMQRYELIPVDERTAGKLESLGGERVRLTYSFEDQRELEDFNVVGSGAAVGFPTLTVADDPFRLMEHKLAARGHASMRTQIELAAPLVVNYKVTYVQPEKDSSTTYFGLGLCDDGQGHFLWAVNLSLLQLCDLHRTEKAEGSDRSLYFNTPYALQLRHDGERVILAREGQELLSLAAGTRVCGAVFLQVHSDPWVQLDDLMIEGLLTPTSFDRLKQAWVEEEMQGL